MLDAVKIRHTSRLLRHVGLPAMVLGVSILAGAGLNSLIKPVLTHWSNNQKAPASSNTQMPSRLMAAELMAVEPVTRPQFGQQNGLQNNVRRAAPNVFAEPAPANPPAQAAPTIATAPEAAITQAVIDNDRPSTALPADYRMFNGRPIRPVRTITMVTTAYSPDERSCGPHADGTTASGKSVWTNGMKMAAADTRLLPFGTLISVPGYYDSQPVPVLDRGGAIKGHRLDMLYPTHEIARTWGRKKQTVTIWEYAD